MKRILTAAAIVAALSAGAAQANLVVTADTNGTSLVNTIVGGGITFSGATWSGDTGANGSGTFTGGNSVGLGIDSGILLTTGTIGCAPGPNNSASCTGPGSSSNLSFNFSVANAGDSVFFNYVFASEEYNEFVGTGYNDSFVLNIDGVNVAVLPGAGGPVTINNVNLGSNSAYYRNNSGGQFPGIQYDGLTTVMTATATNLSAGNHTMQFFITDVGDSSYDSGVFIQAGTFSTTQTPTDVPEPASLALLGLGLAGLGFSRRRKQQLAA